MTEGMIGTVRTLEDAANALLEADGFATEYRASERGEDGRDVLPMSLLDHIEAWLPDEREDAATAVSDASIVVYDGRYAFSRQDGDSMRRPPLGLPAHRTASRFTWAIGEGGYAPPRFSRDSMRVYTTLGTVKVMRLALLGEHLATSEDVLDGLLIGAFPHMHNVLRRRVNRLMGAIPGVRSERVSDRATAHHAGAVKGKRRTASEIANITAAVERTGESEGLPIDTARLERLARAMATASGSWAERVG